MKKKDLETRIAKHLQQSEFEAAEDLCSKLEEIINEMKVEYELAEELKKEDTAD